MRSWLIVFMLLYHAGCAFPGRADSTALHLLAHRVMPECPAVTWDAELSDLTPFVSRGVWELQYSNGSRVCTFLFKEIGLV
jgi:hypothetical protein